MVAKALHILTRYRSTVAVATMACGCALDMLIICITWYRTARVVYAAKKAKIAHPISYYLLRDGALPCPSLR